MFLLTYISWCINRFFANPRVFKLIEIIRKEGGTVMHFPSSVEIIEVGPRDGLQNEKKFVATENKKTLIQQLVNSGIQRIETASFVHPKVVPQMADASEIVDLLQ